MLENLKPERVFHYFEELTKIPRESGNEKAVSDYLYSVGKSFGLETIQDESNNIKVMKIMNLLLFKDIWIWLQKRLTE